MENAKIDENGVKTMLGVSKDDGTNTISIFVDPTTHRLKIANGSSGTDLGNDFASRDGNHFPGILGVSSSDETTVIPVYADPITHELLVTIN